MKLVFSRQALTDLDQIAPIIGPTRARRSLALAVERRFRDLIDRIYHMPEAVPRVSQRSAVRAITVLRNPSRIFYRVRGHTIDILHIRHTSRAPPSPSDRDF